MITNTRTHKNTRYPEIVTAHMVEEAAKIAQIITGTYDWQGVRMVDGTPGLVCLVQEYIDTCKETRICKFQAYEQFGTYWVGSEDEE